MSHPRQVQSVIDKWKRKALAVPLGDINKARRLSRDLLAAAHDLLAVAATIDGLLRDANELCGHVVEKIDDHTGAIYEDLEAVPESVDFDIEGVLGEIKEATRLDAWQEAWSPEGDVSTPQFPITEDLESLAFNGAEGLVETLRGIAVRLKEMPRTPVDASDIQ